MIASNRLYPSNCHLRSHSSPQLAPDALLLLAFTATVTKRRRTFRTVNDRCCFSPSILRNKNRHHNGFHNRVNNARCAHRGVYEDLGTLPENDNYNLEDISTNVNLIQQATEEEIRKWRAQHWIVLIDDESSIRLAIGDYLHSMGYKVVTSCDGPLSFLEMLLWTCGWSFLDSDKQSNVRGKNHQSCPPWLQDVCDAKKNERPWRLPSIIISDIRMPGGIDGVQLLELLKEERSGQAVDDMAKQTKRRRRKKKKSKDKEKKVSDKQTIDPGILAGWVEFATPIATPIDHAKKVLDAIYTTLQYCQSKSSQQSCKNYPRQIQDIPVILLTAKAMVSDRIKGYKAGADGYLPKPFRPEELLCMVDNLMKRQDRERSVQLMNSNMDGKTANLTDDDRMLTVEEMETITNELSEIKGLLQSVIQRK